MATTDKDCDYCSGSGCVFCKQEPEKVEAPKIVEGRLNFTEEETGEFLFSDEGEADIMARYLNTRCSSSRTCPLLRSKCATDCPCFKKAEVSVQEGCEANGHIDGFIISGFKCGNLMFGLN